jgi:hypothetical protein
MLIDGKLIAVLGETRLIAIAPRLSDPPTLANSGLN